MFKVLLDAAFKFKVDDFFEKSLLILALFLFFGRFFHLFLCPSLSKSEIFPDQVDSMQLTIAEHQILAEDIPFAPLTFIKPLKGFNFQIDFSP